MKNYLLYFLFGILFQISISAQPQTGVIKPVRIDSLYSATPSQVHLKGYLGDKIDLCIEKGIKSRNFQDLVDPFKVRLETHFWQTEFWGKWILSAIAAYEHTNDPVMLATIRNAVEGLIATQTNDGYIGNYSHESQLQQWDIWGRKYTLLGLLAYVDISGDKKALEASKKLADYLLTQVGPGKADIVKTGNFRGMPSSSILEPMVSLYRHTGEKRYLEFAKYIVAQWETSHGPGLISKSLEGINVADRFPHPSSWWSWDNGQKAYEMMSCYDGLLDLYRVTGESSYLKSVEKAVQNIIETEINVAGSGTAFECFYHGGQRQTEPTYHTMETCVTFTWIKLCYNLLRLTGNPAYADQIELSTYNALMASMKFDGSQIAKYSPLEGIRHEGEEQCGMHINCCNANGPRAFALLPRFALQVASSAIFVNLYGESASPIALNPKNNVSVKQTSTYPVSDKIVITIEPGKSEIFTIALRIPFWSTSTTVSVNGVLVEGVKAGAYQKITRKWTMGDKILLQLDMRGRMMALNGHQAIMRGPILLARDTRFSDGFVDEAAVVQQNNSLVDLAPEEKKPEHIWMSFTAPLVLGTDLEGDYQTPRQVHFCDFASAGNTWTNDSRYRVWIPQTLNVMKTEYKKY